MAAIGGQFMGLVIGGLLADINWRLVFWINVPFGLVGTIWAYWKLRDAPSRASHKIDWAGNISFAARPRRSSWAAITYGLQPYGDQVMAWTSPKVLTPVRLGISGADRVLLGRAARSPGRWSTSICSASRRFAYGSLASLPRRRSRAAACSSC